MLKNAKKMTNREVIYGIFSVSKNNLSFIQDFLRILEKPYENQTKINEYQSPAAPSKNRYQTFCGT